MQKLWKCKEWWMNDFWPWKWRIREFEPWKTNLEDVWLRYHLIWPNLQGWSEWAKRLREMEDLALGRLDLMNLEPMKMAGFDGKMEKITSQGDWGDAADLWMNKGRGFDVKTQKGTHIFQEIDEDLNTSLVTLDDTNNHQLTQEQTSIKYEFHLLIRPGFMNPKLS